MSSKVVLVTGASVGIGKATAQLLAQQGFKVYAGARRIEHMDELKQYGITPMHLDLTKNTSIEECIQQISDAGDSVDILVNNAGYGSYGALEDVPIAEAKRQFEVNIFGLARLTQLVLPHMRDQHAGKIINISSIGGKFGEPHGSWYHATKFALEGLSDSLRMELNQFNIDVVVIQPGAIATEWNHIASQKLLETSGNTAYGTLAKKHAATLISHVAQHGSDPIVIAEVISKAVRAKYPRTRYAAGSGAKAFLFVRKLLPDCLLDKLLLKFLT